MGNKIKSFWQVRSMIDKMQITLGANIDLLQTCMLTIRNSDYARGPATHPELGRKPCWLRSQFLKQTLFTCRASSLAIAGRRLSRNPQKIFPLESYPLIVMIMRRM